MSKKRNCCSFLLIMSFMVLIQSFTQAQEKALSNKLDTVSYIIGHMMAESIVNQGFKKINGRVLTLAVEEALAGKTSQFDRNAGTRILTQFLEEMKKEEQQDIIQAGKDFLIQNALRPGVVTLESGLQYEVLQEGEGRQPGPDDRVTTHYTGSLIDGTVFDSSVDRGNPITFKVSGVIKGWQEAIPLMKVGSKWMLYVPYELGYGSRGAGNSIPPYATLIFEIDLIRIE